MQLQHTAYGTLGSQVQYLRRREALGGAWRAAVLGLAVLLNRHLLLLRCLGQTRILLKDPRSEINLLLGKGGTMHVQCLLLA